MTRSSICRNLILIGILSIFCVVSSVFADEATRSRFETEYPKAAKFLSDRFDRCQGRFRLEWEENGKRTGMDVEFFRSHGFDKVETRTSDFVDGKKISASNVYCVDDSTAFVVGRVEDQPKWVLYKARLSELEREMFEIDNARFIRAPLGGYQKSLIDMMDEGSIVLVDALVPSDRPTEVEATFRVAGDSLLKQIVASFDPGNHWTVTRQVISVGEPLRVAADYRVEYGSDPIDGVRVPVRVNVERHNNPYRMTEWRFGEIPREQFLLPYYGLPNVISAAQGKRFGWFEWSIVAVIAGATVLGFVLLWFSNRPDADSKERA